VTDIVERLRMNLPSPLLQDEAADVIECLREELANERASSGQVYGELKKDFLAVAAQSEWRAQEIERLKQCLFAEQVSHDNTSKLLNKWRLEDREELDELRALLDLQHTRTSEADAMYIAAHPRPDCPHGYKPDLGTLVGWMLSEIERLTRERDECRKLLREAIELHHDFGKNGQAYFLGDDWLKAARAAGGE